MGTERNYSLADQVVHRRLGDEIVLVHLGTSEIYRLSETGARFWELLSEGEGPTTAALTVAREYDVPGHVVAAEIESLLASLVEAGLLIASDDD